MAAPKPTASAIGGVPASNLAGQLGGREAVEAHVGDHVAAAEERRHGLEQLLAAPQHADARWARTSCGPEKARKSAPMACTSVGMWGTYWQASTMASGAGGVGGVGEPAHRVDGAEHVATWR